MLPIFQQQTNQPFMLMQTQWSQQLNPILALPLNSPSFLQNITVKAGDNVINTKLGRTAQGWILVDTNAALTLYRSAAFNNLTLTLHSSSDAVISLLVF